MLLVIAWRGGRGEGISIGEEGRREGGGEEGVALCEVGFLKGFLRVGGLGLWEIGVGVDGLMIRGSFLSSSLGYMTEIEGFDP